MPLGSDWRSLHPLSPLLRAARVFVLPAVFLIDDIPSEIGGRRGGAVPGLLLAGALLVGLLAGWWAWRATAYRVTNEDVELRTGMFFRRQRRVPLARLESIDVARPLVARVFGLAELRLEAVSNDKSEVRLSYLDYTAALHLRDEIVARRDGTPSPSDGSDGAMELPARRIVRVETRDLVVGTVGGRAAEIWPAVFVVTVVMLLTLGPAAALAFGPFAASVPVLMGLAEAERLYGFTLREVSGGLQISRGLFNEMHQRVALDRIQAVAVVEPLVWRPFRRARLVVDVAGYRGGEQNERRHASVLLPIAPLPMVMTVLRHVQPGLSLEALPHAGAPPASRWRAPVRWRGYSVAWTARHAVMRRGLLRRRTDIVPHVKVQSLRVTQGPWQHALGLATLHVDTAGGEIGARAPHRDRDEAERLAWASRDAAG
ncbi:MAG: PH domain-containing protein [Actinomycetota bacterium]|nr:PH domain-containing protein [Actinomycetota bacterium]